MSLAFFSVSALCSWFMYECYQQSQQQKQQNQTSPSSGWINGSTAHLMSKIMNLLPSRSENPAAEESMKPEEAWQEKKMKKTKQIRRGRKERKKKLHEYRRWFDKNKNKVNWSNWSEIYRQRSDFHLQPEKDNILSHLNDSQPASIHSYDPFD